MLTGNDLAAIELDDRGATPSKVMLRNINTKTISDALEQSFIPSSVKGSSIIKVGDWTYPGIRYCISMSGVISTVVGQTGTLRIKIGSTTLITSTETLPKSLTNMSVVFELYITYTAANTVRVSGWSIIQTASGLAAPVFRQIFTPADVTITTTSDLLLDVTYQFGGAGNSLSVRMINVIKF